MQNIFVFFIVLYEFSTYASNDLIMPGMLNVVNEFHVPVSYISLSLTVYLLGNTCLQLFLGPFSDRFGKRIVILIGVTLFLIFTVYIALSHNIFQFILGRLFQGSGLAYIAIAYSLIHERFNDKEGVKIIALMGNISLLAPLLGPLIGAFIVSLFSWRYIFIFTGFVAFIAFIGLYKSLPKDSKKIENLELKLILITYWKIVKTPRFIIGAISSSISALPILCWIALTPTVVMKTLHQSVLTYSIYQLFAMSGLFLSAIAMHFIAGKVSFYRLLKTMSFVSFIGLSLGFVFHNNMYIIILGIAIYSFGLGIFNNLTFRLVMTTPNMPTGMLTSLMVFIQTIIFAIGIEIADYISNNSNYSLLSFTSVNMIIACIFLVLVRIYALMNKNKGWN